MPEEEFDPLTHALSHMTEEEKDELLVNALNANRANLEAAVGLHNAMQQFAAELEAYDVFGQRRLIMRSMGLRMQILTATARKMMHVDEEQPEYDSAFDEIVKGIDLEGEGNGAR